MRKYVISILFIQIWCIIVFPQDDLSVVAKIGSEDLTAKEFKLRLELSPYIPTNTKIDRHSDVEFKKDFLYSIIAEILWAKEADRIGIGSTERFRLFFQPLEDMFVRDGLFKREIKDKVKLSANDVNDAIEKSQFKLKTFIVSSTDSAQIHLFYNQILAKSIFDSALSKFPNLDTASSEVKLASLKDEKIEDNLFKLGPNEFTSPLKTEIGWVIFKIANKTFTPIDLADESAVNKAKEKVRDRKIEQRYNQYMMELLGSKSIHIDSNAFKSASYLIWKTLKEKPINPNYTNYFPLEEKDFLDIINSAHRKILDHKLFSIDKENLYIKDFVSELAFNGFSVDSLDSLKVINSLARRIKLFVEEQLITKEGYRQAINLSPEVRKDIEQWKQKYLAELYFRSILDSISTTETEIYDVYLKELSNKNSSLLVNIRILTLGSLEQISQIFDLLQQGENFKEIIKGFGKTNELVNELGETGLIPTFLLGDVGKIAAQLKIGEIYGPIQRNNAFSIIQLAEKVDSTSSNLPAFDSIKYNLRNELRLSKTIEQLNKTTASLAEKYNVKIYNEALEKINVTSIPMFIHRFMGFGGRIAGMPLLTPFSEWIENTDIKKFLP